MGSPEEAKSSSSKPSLLSTSTSADSANVQSSRILSGLESSGRINQSVARPKKRRNWSLGIGAVAIVIAGIAAFLYLTIQLSQHRQLDQVINLPLQRPPL